MAMRSTVNAETTQFRCGVTIRADLRSVYGWRVRQTAVINDDDWVLVAVVGWRGDVS